MAIFSWDEEPEIEFHTKGDAISFFQYVVNVLMEPNLSIYKCNQTTFAVTERYASKPGDFVIRWRKEE